MRQIHVDEIITTIRKLCIDANIEIRPDTVSAYHRALDREESEVGREVLRQLIRNAEVARKRRLPFWRNAFGLPKSWLTRTWAPKPYIG
jgi:fumarate hydratase subunit alpha